MSARICLSMIDNASELLKILTDKGATTRAGRIIGALRSVGKGAIADEILLTMRDFGYAVSEYNPFSAETDTTAIYAKSPYAARIRMMWATMREQVLENFPQTPEAVADIESYLEHVDEKYLEDAYHSLSIEGYQVSRELIEKVRSGNWKPDSDDKEQKERTCGAWLLSGISVGKGVGQKDTCGTKMRAAFWKKIIPDGIARCGCRLSPPVFLQRQTSSGIAQIRSIFEVHSTFLLIPALCRTPCRNCSD